MSNESTHKVYIVDGSRTPQLKSRGKVGPFSAGDLAVAAGKPLLLRHSTKRACLDGATKLRIRYAVCRFRV